MLASTMGKNSLLLGGFALLTTLLIAMTHSATEEAIEHNIAQAQQKALLEILPEKDHNNDLLKEAKAVPDPEILGLRHEKAYFTARYDEQVRSIILPVTTRQGYSGDIDLIVGIHRDGSIAGVRVLSHRETPGLGDAIDLKKSPWILSFNGKSLNNPSEKGWNVKKDGGKFDQFTGATITPRAVTRAVKKALDYAEANHDVLFTQPSREINE